jgi:hypothetical protein
LQLSNNVIAGVLDRSTAICARVRPAACMQLFHCSGCSGVAVHLTSLAVQEPLEHRPLCQDLRLRAADSPPSE